MCFFIELHSCILCIPAIVTYCHWSESFSFWYLTELELYTNSALKPGLNLTVLQSSRNHVEIPVAHKL